jgi:hypothetical protein
MMVSNLDIFSILKMEATYSSKSLLIFKALYPEDKSLLHMLLSYCHTLETLSLNTTFRWQHSQGYPLTVGGY